MILLAVAGRSCCGPSSPCRGRPASIGQCSEGGRVVVSLMFDSDNPAVLADPMFSGCRVATYADLMTRELVAFFGARLLVIDRGNGDPLNIAKVVDVESGALSIASGAAKIRQWNTEGRGHVGVYCSRSNRAELVAACAPVRPYEWIATLDGTMDPDGGYPSAVQFAGEDKFGKHVDVSIVYDEGWIPMPHAVDPALLHSVQANAASLLPIAQALAGQVKAL